MNSERQGGSDAERGQLAKPAGGRQLVTRRRVLLSVLVGAAIICVIGVGSVLSLRAALTEARAGRDAVGEFRNGFDLIHALDETRADLETAQGHFAAAAEHLDSRWLWLTRRVPFVGTQIDSADSLAGGGRGATALALTAIDEANLLIDGTTDDRLVLVDELRAIAGRARAGLATIDLGPESGLVSQLHEVRHTLAEQLERTDQDLGLVEEIATGMRRVLAGPTSYLLLVGNNAEMRGGSGSFLSAGVVTFRDANIEVTDLASVHEYDVDLSRVIGSDPSTALWTGIGHTTDWQLLGSSPRFDWTAPLALKMWEDANGDELDGVVAVDAAVLEALLRVTGPVEVGGRTFSSDQVLFEILFNQYFSVTRDNYRTYNETQIQRRDRLGALASASLGALEERDIDTQLLVEVLREVIAGRHLMVWSQADASLWKTLGVDGELAETSLSVSLLNAGGNKLDFWTQLFAELIVDEAESGEVAVEVRVRVVVDPPADAPRYVVGPHPDIAENAGDYLGVMAFHLPAEASAIAVSSGQPIFRRGADGPTEALLVDLEMPGAGTADVVVSFRLPANHPAIIIEPSARIPATRWLFGERRWRSGAAVEIPLGDR